MSSVIPDSIVPDLIVPGSVVNCSREGLDIATGDGVLRLTSLQTPGKQRVSAADFVNAYDLTGQVLGQRS